VSVIRDAERGRARSKSKREKQKNGIEKIENRKMSKSKSLRPKTFPRKISPNLSVAILSVKAAKLSARLDVQITKRSADQCPYIIYIFPSLLPSSSMKRLIYITKIAGR
jgi:hypothetical protein